jgi:DNA-damage-inducible protein J
MTQTTLSIRMDEALKKQFSDVCGDLGLNSTAAITIFAKAVVRQRRIPFEVTANEGQLNSEAEAAPLPAPELQPEPAEEAKPAKAPKNKAPGRAHSKPQQKPRGRR